MLAYALLICMKLFFVAGQPLAAQVQPAMAAQHVTAAYTRFEAAQASKYVARTAQLAPELGVPLPAP
jgi:hypothetical protein